MLFNSYPFIWLYLPLVLGGFFLAARYKQEAAAAWLALCSLFFYGYWDISYVPLLLLSVTVNYQIGKQISNSIEKQLQQRAKIWLLIGLVFDLGLLAHYKYTRFFLETWTTLTGANLSIPDIILPLGISFFTFTQIAYLADCHKGIVKERNPVHYLLFVTYFPHLIAGPILHHKQMMPQFAQAKTYQINQENIAVGLTIFAIGMFKKVIIADSFPEYANPVFAVSKHTGALSMQDAWLGCLSYTLQLYFDFSGYSDMAIGLSRLFGIKLPLNFNSPYKSTSMIDFWNRWHMTLSQFLREYLYFTLGGNKLGKTRRYINMFITMLLGGLWHGAGWTFIVWGGLHGAFLVINHLFRAILPLPQNQKKNWQSFLRPAIGWLFTALAIVSTMVVFRAASLGDALLILKAMAGITSDTTPAIANIVDHTDDGWNVVILVSLIALFAPNTQEIMGRFQPAWDKITSDTRWQWLPNPVLAILAGLALGLSIVNIGQVSEFLYFQF